MCTTLIASYCGVEPTRVNLALVRVGSFPTNCTQGLTSHTYHCNTMYNYLFRFSESLDFMVYHQSCDTSRMYVCYL